MVGNNFKPMTSKQAKKAYKARGGVAQLTDLQKRQLERAVELEERAQAIREKEERKKENARKRELKDAKTAEMRAKQGLPPVPKPKVAASQPRIMAFLGRNGKNAGQQQAKGQTEVESELEDLEDDAGDDDDDEAAEDRSELIEQATAIRASVAEQSQKTATAAEDADALEYDLFWDGVRSQVMEQVFEASQRQTSPTPATRKRRHSATFTRATTLVGRLPADAVDPEVYVNPKDLYVPPSQNVLANKRPRSAGQVDVSEWKEEAAERARLAHRPRSAIVTGSGAFAELASFASTSEAVAINEPVVATREPWNEESEMLDVHQELAALREHGRMMRESEARSRQATVAPLLPAAGMNAPELDLNAEDFADWFPDDSQVQLSPELTHRPFVASQAITELPTIKTNSSHRGLSSTHGNAISSKHGQRHMPPPPVVSDDDLASMLPSDSQALVDETVPLAQPSLELDVDMFPSDSQVQAELDVAASFFPSDSQALASNDRPNTDSATSRPVPPANHPPNREPQAKTVSAKELEELLRGITASQLAVFDDEIANDTSATVEAAAAVMQVATIEGDEFDEDLDLTAGEAAELEAEAIRSSRAQTPVTSMQGVGTTVAEESGSEFGELELSTQELRDLP